MHHEGHARTNTSVVRISMEPTTFPRGSVEISRGSIEISLATMHWLDWLDCSNHEFSSQFKELLDGDSRIFYAFLLGGKRIPHGTFLNRGTFLPISF